MQKALAGLEKDLEITASIQKIYNKMTWYVGQAVRNRPNVAYICIFDVHSLVFLSFNCPFLAGDLSTHLSGVKTARRWAECRRQT